MEVPSICTEMVEQISTAFLYNSACKYLQAEQCVRGQPYPPGKYSSRLPARRCLVSMPTTQKRLRIFLWDTRPRITVPLSAAT